MTQTSGPQRYRLHVYDGAYEVLTDRQYVVSLNLDAPGFDLTLDRHLRQLTEEAQAANEPMDRPRLQVRTLTNIVVLDWSGA